MKFREPTLEEKIVRVKEILRIGNSNLNPISYSTYYMAHAEHKPIYKPYISTNENLYYYQKLTSFSGKDVLVPTASGDHAFNALFLGAKSVETFDINSIAKYQFNLKETAIKYLTRAEFIDFYSSKNLFMKKYYDKIKFGLRKSTRHFFDSLYMFVNNEKSYVTFDELPEENGPKVDKKLIQLNPYLKDERSFNTMKEILLNIKKPITHKVCAADEIVDNFDQKDIIILSNIYGNYLLLTKNIEKPNQYLKNIPQLLKDDGTVSLNYIWGATYAEGRKYIAEEIEKQVPTKKLEIASNPKSILNRSFDTVLYANKEDTITR